LSYLGTRVNTPYRSGEKTALHTFGACLCTYLSPTGKRASSRALSQLDASPGGGPIVDALS